MNLQAPGGGEPEPPLFCSPFDGGHRMLEVCDRWGLETEYFMAKEGDVLIWPADPMDHVPQPIRSLARRRADRSSAPSK
jgi:hypothetical protein